VIPRYGVCVCDEGGTLERSDGTPIDHTWDVVDRHAIDSDGHAVTVSNHDTRTQARGEARRLNQQQISPEVVS